MRTRRLELEEALLLEKRFYEAAESELRKKNTGDPPKLDDDAVAEVHAAVQRASGIVRKRMPLGFADEARSVLPPPSANLATSSNSSASSSSSSSSSGKGGGGGGKKRKQKTLADQLLARQANLASSGDEDDDARGAASAAQLARKAARLADELEEARAKIPARAGQAVLDRFARASAAQREALEAEPQPPVTRPPYGEAVVRSVADGAGGFYRTISEAMGRLNDVAASSDALASGVVDAVDAPHDKVLRELQAQAGRGGKGTGKKRATKKARGK